MDNNSAHTVCLLERARAGDRSALSEIFARHRDRLLRLVELRLDRQLQAQLASGVLQDAFLEAVGRLEVYLQDPRLPVFLWLRQIVGEKLVALHRQHLGPEKSDDDLELSLYRGALPAANSVALAAHLLGQPTSPSQAAVRAERLLRVQEALNGLDPLDREILSLRQLEQLSRTEAALVLGIEESAAAKRHILALKRLKNVLADIPGGLEGS
jgi:RNA polymerase sigma-70 factor (ECF subfamily)